MAETENQNQHVCKFMPIRGTYALSHVQQEGKAFRKLVDCIPVKAVLCEGCGEVRFFSYNVVVAQLRIAAQIRAEQAKLNGQPKAEEAPKESTGPDGV